MTEAIAKALAPPTTPRLVTLSHVRALLERPVDARWLGTFRILFGATMAVSMLRFIAYGWIDSFFVAPTFHFKYWGFSWVQPLSGPWMHGLFWALAALAVAMSLGIFARASAWAFVLGFTYLSLLDVTTYLNHYYLAILLGALIALSPAHRVLALDVRLMRRESLASVPTFWLWLFRFQMGAVYTFAGLAKLHGDWLLHGQPLRIWLASHTDMPVLGALFQLEHAALVMSWAGFLFDTTVAWFLLYRPTRRYAYVLLVIFHVLTRLLFPIGMFPVIMIVGATLFFDPAWLGRFGGVARPAFPAARIRLPRYALATALLFCCAQLALPLRFLAYGGNVRWHEQGMRWSWRVMVREKNGSVTFLVRQKQTGREWQVSPHRYLTRLQEREMAGQPDLILQLAHHIRDDFAARGLGAVEVRVDAVASLNGRPMRRLIDAQVDLTEARDGLLPAAWILPAPEDSPPHLRSI